MDGRRRHCALTLGVSVVVFGMAGCAGAGHRGGPQLASRGGLGHDVAHGHSTSDPFLPQAAPARGLARFFPGLGRGKQSADPLADGSLGPEFDSGMAQAARPGLGFERRPAPAAGIDPALELDLGPASSPNSGAGSGLLGGRGGRPPAPVVTGGFGDPLARGDAVPPPMLPVAIVAELEPGSRPVDASTRARAQLAAASRDAQARRARVAPNDLGPPLVPPPSDPDPAPVGPSADLPDPVPAAPGPGGPEPLDDPFAGLAPPPGALLAAPADLPGAFAEAPAPDDDPFADFGPPPADAEQPAPAEDRFAGSAPVAPREGARRDFERFGGSNLPPSRRLTRRDPDLDRDPVLSGRPRLAGEADPRDGVPPQLPPVEFPRSYYDKPHDHAPQARGPQHQHDHAPQARAHQHDHAPQARAHQHDHDDQAPKRLLPRLFGRRRDAQESYDPTDVSDRRR